MKAVLMSMKPEWWEKILSGEKTLEIRKSAPQSKGGRVFRWPLTVLVYVSGTGAVQGQFTCPGWIKVNPLREMCTSGTGLMQNQFAHPEWIKTDPMDLLAEQSCVPRVNLWTYANGMGLYGWVVEDPEKYTTPSPLAEFGLTHPPMSWQYVEIPDMEAEV